MAKVSGYDRLVAMLGHLGLAYPIILPLLLFVLEKDKSNKAWEVEHLKQAVVFQLSFLIAVAVIGILGFIFLSIVTLITFGMGAILFPVGAVILGIIVLVGVLLMLYAAWKAIKGESYSYPITGKFFSK